MTRRAMQAKIHIAKKDLGMSNEMYRDVLFAATGVSSTKDMDSHQLRKVLEQFKQRGWKPKVKRTDKYGTPKNIRTHANSKQLLKIQAILADNKLHWNYAHAMASQMYAKDKVQFCTSDELHAITVAMIKYYGNERKNK